jgi:hypothetical protein
MVSTRRPLRSLTPSPSTPPPPVITPITRTITRTTTCLDLNLPSRQVCCQKCLKVLSTTPDYDRTNPAHRQRRLSLVHFSFQCEKPWDTNKYLQKGVRQGQVNRCLAANDFLRGIGLVAPDRVLDSGSPTKKIASVASSTQEPTRDSDQVDPLRSLWDHSTLPPASPTPFATDDTTDDTTIAVRVCQGWAGNKYDRLFQISYRENVLPYVKTMDAQTAVATFGLARRFLKHANALQLRFVQDKEKFVLRHKEKCLGPAVRKLCHRCSNLSRSVAHLVEAAKREATDRLNTAQLENLGPSVAANLIDRIRSRSKQELRNAIKRETRLRQRLRMYLEKR